ncbi:MAG: hypothetical protein LN588_02515 [Rickettsia endosymbiont of Bryobia graminum]|nr:hypothetical protein [Rickettsia endosymbiont of Bryobia graminum]
MPTGNKKLFNSLKQVEQEVNRIVTAKGIEFKKLQQEFGLLNDYNDQMSATLAGSWNSGENDREVEEELNRLMAEAKLEQKETELNKGSGKVPTTVEGPIPTVPTMEELTGGVELKRDSSQDQRLSAAGFSFNENKEFITINLDAQTMIAKSSSEISADLEEKEQLNEVGDRLGMISQVVKNTEISKEDQPRMFEIISKGLEKIYDGIKEGVSSTLDGIKKLGGKFVESIKSIFKESPEEAA